MIRCDQVRARIEARVPALTGQLYGAGKFADVVERNLLPEVTPAGFVLLGGLVGGKAEAATGWFHQHFMEAATVVIIERHAGDPTGDEAGDKITPLVRDVIFGVCGWCPGEGEDDEALGAFQLERAEFVGVKQGATLFQIDFALNDQLRINPS